MDQFQGQDTSVKTFYKAVEISSDNTNIRTFKANRASYKLINAELNKGNWILRVKHTGTGMNTVYVPTPVKEKEN